MFVLELATKPDPVRVVVLFSVMQVHRISQTVDAIGIPTSGLELKVTTTEILHRMVIPQLA